MSTKELVLFEKDNMTIKKKFYYLLEMLLFHQSTSRLESLIFMGIFFFQTISGFFAKQIGVFDPENAESDKILGYIQKILRLKDLFENNFNALQAVIYIAFILVVFFSIYFIVLCLKTKKDPIYTCYEFILNCYIKVFIYVGFNMILDLTLSTICFESSGTNPFFNDASCRIGDHLGIVIISIILFIIAIFFHIFIQFFYCDSLYLSTSYYAKISCNYELYMSINCICYSILLTYAKYLSKEVFLIYNIIVSLVLLDFYLKRYLYYDHFTNIFAGLFHLLYAWTSIFSMIFAYLKFKEKGIIYIFSSAIALYFYFNLKGKVEESILLSKPYFKIKNKYHLLYYIKNLIDKMNHYKEDAKERALLTGIMQIHPIECPNPLCLAKTKKKIYLPMTNEWSDRSKPMIQDKVFLTNFITVIMSYFISQSYYSPEMIINLSLYYLQIIGNYCKALFFYKKVKEMKLTLQEHFSLVRLELTIARTLKEKFKPPNEPCFSLEDLNITMYFKYEELSQNFYDEINNDLNLSLEFWRSFRNAQIDQNKTIDFNKIFHLTDKIRITKTKVEQIWGNLIKIFNGVNDLFELYLEYAQQINDDDGLKRELETIKRKNENSTEHIQQNFYSILFSRDTGIIIANGDKGKEGLIEKTNKEIEQIFKYKSEELRGINLTSLMPKLFETQHNDFMENYFEVGEKRVIDNKDFKTFAKDKENSIIMIRLAIKLFPMLNESVYFVGMMVKENIDDIIFIDNNFNIQGMSMKIMKILQIENRLLFQDNEIPFYVICKKFVNFYKIFLREKTRAKKDIKKTSSIIIEETSSLNDIQVELPEQEENTDKDSEVHENIEINENIELEYEIRLPQFLIDYSNSTAKKDIKQGLKLMKTLSQNSEQNFGQENFKEQTFDDFGETDLLVDEGDNKTPGYPQNGDVQNQITQKPTEVHDASISQNQKLDFNKESDEQKEFKEKLNEHRELFEKGAFNELENLIDKYTADSSINDFKFNFTFDRYKYGNRQIAYIVRCIDNKNEGGNSDSDSVAEMNDTKAAKYKKEKSDALKNLIEVYDSEKTEIVNLIDNFTSLRAGNRDFQHLLDQCKEDIIKMSKVHGMKKEDVVDDENSSQSSKAGFNSDLFKRSRIEEIRANLLKNVSNFYTLKYIKILVSVASLVTIVFCALYLVFFKWVYDDLSTVSELNINLFQTTLWMSNLLATMISLRTLYFFETETTYQGLVLNSFIDGKENYFKYMKESSIEWYNNIITSFGELEDKIGLYVKNSENTFWDNERVTYNEVLINDDEAFPLSLGQVLSAVNSLLKNEYFVLSPQFPNDPTKIKELIKYLGLLSIENTYDNLISAQFSKIKSIPITFKDYNKSSINILLYAVLIYSCCMIVVTLVYSVFLFITNKNMGEGLEKVTKIKLDKIEETISKIESFNGYLKKYRDREAVKSNAVDNTETKQGETQIVVPQKNTNTNNLGGFSSDYKKHKKLKILSYSYLQILGIYSLLCSFLIPIYLVTDKMVTNTNQLLDVQSYLFGKILTASASTVKVKCEISKCETEVDLNYNNLVNKSEIQLIVQGISVFSELNDFYNNKFLLNACDTAFDQTSDPVKYEECINDALIQSANNTDSILKLIDETVNNIYKDEEMKEGKIVEYPNNTNALFTPELLYNSDSFKELETIFYKYITPVNDNFARIIKNSLESYLNNKEIMIIILICVFGVLMMGICGYIGLFFVDKLIHLLSVSRCIMKIIPTVVINNTQELENWIENKY